MLINKSNLMASDLKNAIVLSPLTISKSATVRQAIAMMSDVRSQCPMNEIIEPLDLIHLEARSSCVIVLENDQVIGILTERDIIRLTAEKTCLDHLISTVMTQEVAVLNESDFTDLFSTVDILYRHGIRHLPVVDQNNRLIGLITHETLRQITRPIDLLRVRQVHEVMIKEVVCATPETTILQIFQLMAHHSVSCVVIVTIDPLTSMKFPVGLLSERDLLQFQALGLDFEQVISKVVMNNQIYSINPEESLWKVQQVMQEQLIQRMIVLGSQGELLGIVTQTTVLQALNPAELYHLATLLEEKVVRLEAENLEREARYRGLMKGASDGIFLADLQGNILEANHKMAELLGYTQNELTSMHFNQLQEKLDLPQITVAFEWLAHQKFCQVLDVNFLSQKGEIIPIDISASVLEINSETIVQIICHDIRDRKQVEQENQKLRERLQFLLASSPAIIYGCKPGGDYQTIFISQNAKTILGYEISNFYLSSSFWFDHIHPEDVNEILASIPTLLKQGYYSFEYRFLHSKGYYLWLQDECCLMRDAQGNPMEIVGYCADISDRKHIYANLANLSQRLTVALKSGKIGYWEWDIQQNFIFWDERMYNLYGLLPPSGADNSRVPYTIWSNAIYPEDRQQIEHLLNQAVLGEAKYETEFRVVHPNGTIHYIKAYGEVIYDNKNQPKSMIGVNFDISHRKWAEMALQDSEIRFRRVFESNVVGMIFTDFSGKVTDANDHFLKMIGYTRVELEMGLINWAQITPPEYRDLDIEAIEQLRKHNSITPWEKAYIHKDGHWVWVLIGVAMLSQEDGSCVCVFVDISLRKKAEQTIHQQANQEKLLREITQRIRQSLDIQTIFDTACQEIRHLLSSDRVGIFKFAPDTKLQEGEFVAESVVPKFPSVLNNRVYSYCLGSKYLPLYLYGYYGIISNNQKLEECHQNLLNKFQIQANLVMPLLCGDSLWGLLCIHQCDAPRVWEQSEIHLAQQLANQLAIAIQQAVLYEQVQSELQVRQKAEAKIAQQLKEQKVIDQIIQQMRESLNLNEILAVATQQIKDVLQCDRVIVFRVFPRGNSGIVEEAVDSEFARLKDLHWDDEVWSQDILDVYWQGKPRIVSDVMKDIWTDCLVEYSQQGQIKSKIVAPILLEASRNEKHRWISTKQNYRLWGVLVIHACREQRVWQESEAELLQQIANQLAIAIQQSNLFEQLQEELGERQQAQQNLVIANEELMRATRLKDEFLANMSHELRTPLNAILGMTEGLQEQIFGPINDKQQKAVETIERSGFHLLALINDILDLAKIESGQMELDLTPTAIGPLCQSSLTFVKQQALKKQILLEIQIPLNLPKLLIDERRFRQVLINLLNNAVKFTPDGGRVMLIVSMESLVEEELKHFIRFSITDTGIGISPENISKLFKPFIQIDSALNRQYQGTGLGLALVKSIVDLHGGVIQLTSELGVGSCFMIDLPYNLLVWPTSEPNTALSTGSYTNLNLATEISALTNLTESPLILLAEDQEANISTIVSYLTAKGYRLILAHHGEEAIALAQAQNPDLILMDIQMPKMDGLAAIKYIRNDPNLVNIPIIAITSLAMEGDRERCLAAGANDYMSKPLKLKQLVTVIQQLLNQGG